ncbi:MAG: hypothetical protein ACTMIR_14640 [Cellulomonadaceae bacterium]
MSSEAMADATDPELDRALAPLDTVADRPLGEHVEVFEGVYAALQDHLARSGDR